MGAVVVTQVIYVDLAWHSHSEWVLKVRNMPECIIIRTTYYKKDYIVMTGRGSGLRPAARVRTSSASLAERGVGWGRALVKFSNYPYSFLYIKPPHNECQCMSHQKKMDCLDGYIQITVHDIKQGSLADRGTPKNA